MYAITKLNLRQAATLAILGSALLSTTVMAAPTDGTPVAPAPAANSMMKDHGKMEHHKPISPEEMRDHLERHIKHLHDKLRITAEQEASWQGVVKAMRDNEAATVDLFRKNHQEGKMLTAPESLDAHIMMAEARTAGLKNTAAAVKALYGELSDEQKKAADEAFTHFGHPMMEHGEHKGWGHDHVKHSNTDKPADAVKPVK